MDPGSELRAWRKGQGLTCGKVAELLGANYHYTLISHWERGEKTPSYEGAVRIWRLTGIEPGAWSDSYGELFGSTQGKLADKAAAGEAC